LDGNPFSQTFSEKSDRGFGVLIDPVVRNAYAFLGIDTL
jgi:hypothetical protein